MIQGNPTSKGTAYFAIPRKTTPSPHTERNYYTYFIPIYVNYSSLILTFV